MNVERIGDLLSRFRGDRRNNNEEEEEEEEEEEDRMDKSSTHNLIIKKIRRIQTDRELDGIQSRLKLTKIGGKIRRKRVCRSVVALPYDKDSFSARLRFRKGEIVHIVENGIKVNRGTIIKVPKHGRWVTLYCEDQSKRIERVDVNKLVSDEHLNI